MGHGPAGPQLPVGRGHLTYSADGAVQYENIRLHNKFGVMLTANIKSGYSTEVGFI